MLEIAKAFSNDHYPTKAIRLSDAPCSFIGIYTNHQSPNLHILIDKYNVSGNSSGRIESILIAH